MVTLSDDRKQTGIKQTDEADRRMNRWKDGQVYRQIIGLTEGR
jgi:hypothetical protein